MGPRSDLNVLPRSRYGHKLLRQVPRANICSNSFTAVPRENVDCDVNLLLTGKIALL